ncbi:hypothetical protein BCR33DRAFT_714611 [Rhizoclosmatium globosum]|uniref:Mid2 domain-containing protein n=1 Tax=Rhizoclosmatium globosum TaxID=329046 RepID=A0A1Y2CME6_9FUNG|nr:hypothetical protein BCR33DRAFT_714611 [Rhizoclosmatium globosum]|eukprot:ORY48208.1 hypothetical protein BCR33DRAFT_714611 [Rhizoclosmatium globosum]
MSLANTVNVEAAITTIAPVLRPQLSSTTSLAVLVVTATAQAEAVPPTTTSSTTTLAILTVDSSQLIDTLKVTTALENAQVKPTSGVLVVGPVASNNISTSLSTASSTVSSAVQPATASDSGTKASDLKTLAFVGGTAAIVILIAFAYFIYVRLLRKRNSPSVSLDSLLLAAGPDSRATPRNQNQMVSKQAVMTAQRRNSIGSSSSVVYLHRDIEFTVPAPSPAPSSASLRLPQREVSKSLPSIPSEPIYYSFEQQSQQQSHPQQHQVPFQQYQHHGSPEAYHQAQQQYYSQYSQQPQQYQYQPH